MRECERIPVQCYAMVGVLALLTLLMSASALGFSLFMLSLVTRIPIPELPA